MGLRQRMVTEMKKILGNGNFIYGGYKDKPSTPYGLYSRTESDYFYLDDKVAIKKNNYLVRVVTKDKDFKLEERIENTFDMLEINYQVVTEEDIEREKVHCTEWEIEIIE